MFGGVTEGMGRVVSVRRVGAIHELPLQRLTVDVPEKIIKNLGHGGSISVNGVCLSVISKRAQAVMFDVVAETLRCTTLGSLCPGECVNLERPLRYGARVEGHYVLGHVDGVATIDRVRRRGRQTSFRMHFPPRLKRFLPEKGSVALDGVSLTVGQVEKSAFWVHCVPMTLKKTTFGLRKVGDRVNLEADILIKSRVRV